VGVEGGGGNQSVEERIEPGDRPGTVQNFQEQIAGQAGFKDKQGVHAGFLAVVNHQGGEAKNGSSQQSRWARG
jgi:hypothetical protein